MAMEKTFNATEAENRLYQAWETAGAFKAGLLGINVGGIPGVDNANAFWIVCAGLVGIGLVLMLVFWRAGLLGRR